jgi:hypothetical protein
VPVALTTMTGSGVLAAPIVGGLSLGAATGAGTLVGGFAVAAVIAGSVALGLAPSYAGDTGSTPPPVAVEQQTEAPPTGAADGATPGATTGTLVGDVLAGDVQGVGTTLGDTVESVVDTITNDDGSVVAANVSLHLTGTGTPGASVTARAAGQVYANVVVDAAGNYVVDIAAFPGGLASLELVQTVDRSYLRGLVLGDNPLAEVLGLVDGLINALVQPLGLSSGGGTVAVHLVG